MTECEECIVTGEMARVLRLSRVFGIAPVNIRPAPTTKECNVIAIGNCYQVSASKKYGIISSVLLFITWLICVVMYVYVTGIMESEKAIRIRTGLSLILNAIITILHELVLLFIAFRGQNKVKLIMSYLTYIQKLNQALKNSYLNIKLKKSKIIIWGYFISIYIIALIFICQRTLDVIFGKKSVVIVIMQLFYFVSFSIHILIQFQFAFVVYLLNATIRIFNDRLQSWNCKWDNEFNNIIVTNRTHITFRRLCQIYVAICKLITKIDKHESVFIFLLLSYKILDLLDALYLIMSSIQHFTTLPANIVPASLLDFAVEVLWFIYRAAALILLIEPCNQTVTELQALKLQISNLIWKTNKNYDREELFIFCRQLITDLPVFSPLGICSLRRQELVTVIGVIFTFLAIITQFHLRDGLAQ